LGHTIWKCGELSFSSKGYENIIFVIKPFSPHFTNIKRENPNGDTPQIIP
jgi:hypothetical protein